MKPPFDFQKFFIKNIQKTKNGLRPSSVCFTDSFPPGGSLYEGNFSNKKEK